jgi:predicted nucleic acid-binding protein
MDKVFVDTNVILDHIAARVPFDQEAKVIFQRAELGQIELYASVLSLCNVAYILRKILPGTNISQTLTDLHNLINLTKIDTLTVFAALQSSFTDFEDAIQHFSAVQHGGITHLVTRNPNDFKNSLIQVHTPKQYLSANP